MPTPDAAAPTVSLQGVERCFNRRPAVQDLTFEAPPGAITAMLGPNGAGKTTALRLITGALLPDRGSIRVFGVDPGTAAGEDVRRRCGVVTAKPSLYDRLSGLDNLRYSAQLYGLGRGAAVDRRLAAAAAQFGIDEALGQAVGGYSTGMKTRLALARAVAHDPELLLLDEPTSGLDPESAAAVLELVRAMTSHGRTVLLCTHLLAEADGLADQVVVLERGTAVATGDPARLAAGFWPRPQVRLRAERGRELDLVAAEAGVVAYERQADAALVTLDRPGRVSDLVLALSRHGVRLAAVEPVHHSLEDLYFAIQAARRGAAAPPTAAPAAEAPAAPEAPTSEVPAGSAPAPVAGPVPDAAPPASAPAPPARTDTLEVGS